MEAPASWLVAQQHLLPRRGRALDVACGRGRHALWLARRGLSVVAIDRDAAAIGDLTEHARGLNLPVEPHVADLENLRIDLGHDRYDAIVVFNYLHRPLVPHLVTALRQHGVLVYETFTREQARHGKPRNPDYLLEPGELSRLVVPLHVEVSREGEYEGRHVASIVARRRGGGAGK